MAVALAQRAAGEALDIVQMRGVRFAWPGKGAFSLAVDSASEALLLAS